MNIKLTMIFVQSRLFHCDFLEMISTCRIQIERQQTFSINYFFKWYLIQIIRSLGIQFWSKQKSKCVLFSSFLHITKAISTNSFCVCQPDRPGPVCTLENKCSGFQNENQILVVNKLSTTNPQKNINLYSLINDNIRNNFNSSINFIFDVYGSPASKPVIFDFKQ